MCSFLITNYLKLGWKCDETCSWTAEPTEYFFLKSTPVLRSSNQLCSKNYNFPFLKSGSFDLLYCITHTHTAGWVCVKQEVCSRWSSASVIQVLTATQERRGRRTLLASPQQILPGDVSSVLHSLSLAWQLPFAVTTRVLPGVTSSHHTEPALWHAQKLTTRATQQVQLRTPVRLRIKIQLKPIQFWIWSNSLL